uniref:Uncharacterized protein n=1 Tax=Oryza sativa subsp. japonica TaxID=39947 RepID=Q6L4P4_ORYSJ|nr:unknown protein [Oryza sativa Japonica Group]
MARLGIGVAAAAAAVVAATLVVSCLRASPAEAYSGGGLLQPAAHHGPPRRHLLLVVRRQAGAAVLSGGGGRRRAAPAGAGGEEADEPVRQLLGAGREQGAVQQARPDLLPELRVAAGGESLPPRLLRHYPLLPQHELTMMMMVITSLSIQIPQFPIRPIH